MIDLMYEEIVKHTPTVPPGIAEGEIEIPVLA